MGRPKIVIKDRAINIPYILDGQLYQIIKLEGDHVAVKCCHCPSDRVYHGSVRSTGNFHMHIKRRHPDLLGKLHEMKVASLLEKRHVQMKNRQLLESLRSASDSSAVEPTNSTAIDSQLSESEIIHNHKLKIKTAFERHQQQEAMRMGSSDTFTPEQSGPLETAAEAAEPFHYESLEMDKDNPRNANLAIPNELPPTATSRDFPSLGSQSSGVLNRSPLPAYTNDGFLNSAQIMVKCETSLANTERALDLSLNSLETSSSGLGSDDIMPLSISQHPANDSEHMPCTMLQNLEKLFRGIQSEMKIRNEIEKKRILLEKAKFQFLHPQFHFDI